MFTLSSVFSNWRCAWSISDVIDAMDEVALDDYKCLGAELSVSDEFADYDISFKVESIEDCLEEALEKGRSWLVNFIEKTEKKLHENAGDSALVRYFYFPSHIRTACEQYLTYFVQFLRDLELEARYEVKEEPGRVMFSVIPDNGKEALAAVRKALSVYLSLPSAPDFDGIANNTSEVAVMQLQANVFHLKSQIILAESMIRNQNLTIEAQSAAIRTLEAFCERNHLVSSDASDSDKSKESIIGDLVYAKKVEKMGLEVDLPGIIRKLKRRFSK